MKRTISLLLLALSFSYLQAQSLPILVFSKTNGFRHKSIPAGQEALKQLAAKNHWQLTFTEDSTQFSHYKALRQYKTIIFLGVTGKIFGTKEEKAFQKYIESGGSLVTIHTGTDTEQDWPWYVATIGTTFKNHPKPQQAKFVVTDQLHPSTSMLPKEWTRQDELYNFNTPIPADKKVLIELDETSYQGGTMGKHPIAWYGYCKKGRVLQTALGHTDESYADPLFLQHIEGAIKWAAGLL